MAKYQWREGSPKPAVEADVFGLEIEKIASGDPLDTIDPAKVVDAAKSRRSPIHKMFNWDDAEAADLHRRAQARNYIGALQIVRVEVREGSALSSRAFYSVRSNDGRGYVSRDRILSDMDLRRQVMAAARSELERYLTKYAEVLAFGNYVERLQGALDEMRDELDRLESEATSRARGRSRTDAKAPMAASAQ